MTFNKAGLALGFLFLAAVPLTHASLTTMPGESSINWKKFRVKTATGQSAVSEFYNPENQDVDVAELYGEGPFDATTDDNIKVTLTRAEYNAMIASGYEGVNLYNLRAWEKKHLSEKEIRDAGMADLHKMWNFPGPKNLNGKKLGLPLETIKDVLQSMREHPVIGREQARKYDPGYTTRFCFGQATYAHHVLLSLGLHPESIRKVFIVGPRMMPRTGLESFFHVATVARGEDNNWYTVDVGFQAPMRLQWWFDYFSKQAETTDGKLRLYVTMPTRFSPPDPVYTELDLGLTLKRSDDFYKGYFVDLFKWLREPRNLEEHGLYPIPANEVDWPAATAKYIYR